MSDAFYFPYVTICHLLYLQPYTMPSHFMLLFHFIQQHISFCHAYIHTTRTAYAAWLPQKAMLFEEDRRMLYSHAMPQEKETYQPRQQSICYAPGLLMPAASSSQHNVFSHACFGCLRCWAQLLATPWYAMSPPYYHFQPQGALGRLRWITTLLPSFFSSCLPLRRARARAFPQ